MVKRIIPGPIPTPATKRVALVTRGRVTNVAAFLAAAPVNGTTEIASDTAQIGDNAAGGVITRGRRTHPEEVQQRALVRALQIKGNWGQVRSWIAQLSDDDRDTWNTGGVIKRGDAFVAALRVQLALTEIEMDEIFVAAGKIE